MERQEIELIRKSNMMKVFVKIIRLHIEKDNLCNGNRKRQMALKKKKITTCSHSTNKEPRQPLGSGRVK